MSLWHEISPDPKEPLSVEEFRRVYASWLKGITDATDEEIAAVIPVIPQEQFDEAIRMEKFGVYKKILWEKIKLFDLDP